MKELIFIVYSHCACKNYFSFYSAFFFKKASPLTLYKATLHIVLLEPPLSDLSRKDVR